MEAAELEKHVATAMAKHMAAPAPVPVVPAAPPVAVAPAVAAQDSAATAANGIVKFWAPISTFILLLVGGGMAWSEFGELKKAKAVQAEQIEKLEKSTIHQILKERVSAAENITAINTKTIAEIREEQHKRSRSVATVEVLETKFQTVKEDVIEIKEMVRELYRMQMGAAAKPPSK